MVPRRIREYLNHHDVPYAIRSHPRRIRAQRLAETLHVSGFELAKSVIFEADGVPWIAVAPAAGRVDMDRIGEILGTYDIMLLDEITFSRLFPDCEVGAEPPFGCLFGLPVLMDQSLREHLFISMRAGSHEEIIQMRTADFERLERPRLGTFAVLPEKHRYISTVSGGSSHTFHGPA